MEEMSGRSEGRRVRRELAGKEGRSSRLTWEKFVEEDGAF